MTKMLLTLFMVFSLSTQLIFSVDLMVPVRNKKKHSAKNQKEALTPMPSLYNKILTTDIRYPTFDLVFQLMEERNVKILVETGTARLGENCAQGCSTLLFAEWAKSHNAQLFSVDISPISINASEKAVRSINPDVAYHCMDSVAFLEEFDQMIDFLYLDSYDFDPHNPELSQQHHLKEIIAAYPHLGNHSVVLINDCNLLYGAKGKLAIEWLLGRGWKILLSDYQTILIQELLRPISLERFEKKCYSQNGEDGVLQTIFHLIGSPTQYYVEFGVENGKECNTRFLRENKGWKGLMMDGKCEDLGINLHREYILSENINDLFKKYNVPQEFDLLSIDIDYNDFHIWHAIDSKYRPRVVVIEYNATHLPTEDNVVVYDPHHWWDGTNYFGAGILSLYLLGKQKGYTLIYAENKGVNLFFVRNDVLEKEKIDFLNQNNVALLYKAPRYGWGPRRGHVQDPYYRPYLKAADILN